MLSTEQLEGKTLGKYEIRRKVGDGGQAVVYEAWHVDFEAPVAIKFLQDHLAKREGVRTRFKREARLQFQLKHSNIVHVIEIIEDEGLLGMAMDWVEGQDLEQRLQYLGRPFTKDEVQRLFLPVLDGVGYAHERMVIHRDLKPSNILLDRSSGQEIPKVMDFGIAKSLEDPSHHTKTNAVLGTPHYIAPEQAAVNKMIDHRADIYALGVTLYQLVSGRLPFDGLDLVQLITAHIMEPPPPLASLGLEVDPALEAVILKAMAKRPQERFQDCASFAQTLGAVLRGQTDRAMDTLGPFLQQMQGTPHEQGPLPTGDLNAFHEPLPTAASHDALTPPAISPPPSGAVLRPPTESTDATPHPPTTSNARRWRIPGLLAMTAVFVAGVLFARRGLQPPTRPITSKTSSTPARPRTPLGRTLPVPDAGSRLPERTTPPEPQTSPDTSITHNATTTPEATRPTPRTPDKPPLRRAKKRRKPPMRRRFRRRRIASRKQRPRARKKRRKRQRRRRRPSLQMASKYKTCKDCLYDYARQKPIRELTEACHTRRIREANQLCRKWCVYNEETAFAHGTLYPYILKEKNTYIGRRAIMDHAKDCRIPFSRRFSYVFKGYRDNNTSSWMRCYSKFLRGIRSGFSKMEDPWRLGWRPEPYRSKDNPRKGIPRKRRRRR